MPARQPHPRRRAAPSRRARRRVPRRGRARLEDQAARADGARAWRRMSARPSGGASRAHPGLGLGLGRRRRRPRPARPRTSPARSAAPARRSRATSSSARRRFGCCSSRRFAASTCCCSARPRTAKSELGRRLSAVCGGDGVFFERLLTRFSVPEELFGLIIHARLRERPATCVDGGILYARTRRRRWRLWTRCSKPTRVA